MSSAHTQLGYMHLPPSLEEACILSQQKCLIKVKVHCFMPRISSPIFGTVGPFEPNNSMLIPLHLVRLLCKENIISVEIPHWLSEEYLKVLLQKETAVEMLCACPHPQYIEIAQFFKKGSHNAWANCENPNQARYRVMALLDDLIALRRRKIFQLNQMLIQNRAVSTTLLSDFERRLLSTSCVDFLNKFLLPPTRCTGTLQRPPVPDSSRIYTEQLEDILASMNAFDAEEHYALQEEGQRLCLQKASLNEPSSISEFQ